MSKWEPALDRGLRTLSDPRLSNPKPRWERSAAMAREEFGVNIAVCPCLLSFLLPNKHHPFENKVWEIYIFIRSVFVRYWPVDYVPVYICICICAVVLWIYNIILKKCRNSQKPLTGSEGDTCSEKELSTWKGDHFSPSRTDTSFTRPLAANSWLIRLSNLTPCLLLRSRHRRNQQYKKHRLRTYQPPEATSIF